MAIPVKRSPESGNTSPMPYVLAAAGFLAVALMVAKGNLFGGGTPEQPAPSHSPEPTATTTSSPAAPQDRLQEQLREEACRLAQERHLPLPTGLDC